MGHHGAPWGLVIGRKRVDTSKKCRHGSAVLGFDTVDRRKKPRATVPSNCATAVAQLQLNCAPWHQRLAGWQAGRAGWAGWARLATCLAGWPEFGIFFQSFFGPPNGLKLFPRAPGGLGGHFPAIFGLFWGPGGALGGKFFPPYFSF